MFIDIHTHIKREPSADVIEFLDNVHFVGIHPWFIKDSFMSDFQEIERRHLNENIPFIGETGLDRLKSNVNFDTQLEVFKIHIELSIKLNRPLVIHCLKAHSDFLQLLKEIQYSGKFLIHDFSGGEKELDQYLKYNAYFSFGRSLFRENSKAEMVFKKVPLDRFFLETDDSTQYSIQEIYQRGAELRRLDSLEDQIIKNFLVFFNYANDLRPADIFKNFC